MTIQSPDKLIEVTVSNPDNHLQYQISKDGQMIIFPSSLGLQTDSWDLTRGETGSIETTEVNTTWEPIYGKTSQIVKHYHEAVIPYQSEDGSTMQVVFRVFDDGVAFRYEIPEQQSLDSILIRKDISEFRFGDDYMCFTIQRDVEEDPFIPEELTNSSFSQSPVLVHAGDVWVALNEAAVYDMSMMYFVNPDRETLMRADIETSRVALPARTPWRVIQIGDRAGDIVESDIIANLNEPCDKEEFSWVGPGKTMWDHRNQGDTVNGFVYSRDRESLIRLIDFAYENNIEYLLVEEWFMNRGQEFAKEIIQYGADRSVKLILYSDRLGTGSDWDLEERLSMFSSWGAAGLKYGFLVNEFGYPGDIDRQGFVKETQRIVETCAKYEMILNFHDRPVPPSGTQYTWPNLIVTEYCHAQQDGRSSFGPHKAVVVPFLNGLNAGLDMSVGFYDLYGVQNRQYVDEAGMNSTVAGETARCLVNYSPLLILPDNGDVYNQKADLFEFIRELPDTWDEMKLLEGEPGDYIIMARRTGDDWFVAGNTDEESRTFEVSLDFLGDGSYDITHYTDTRETHYKTNKDSYEVSKFQGTKDSLIKAYMAPGGGFCLKIIKTD